MIGLGKWLNYNYESKIAVEIDTKNGAKPVKKVEEKQTCKPDGYKNVNSSSARFLTDTNLASK